MDKKSALGDLLSDPGPAHVQANLPGTLPGNADDGRRGALARTVLIVDDVAAQGMYLRELCRGLECEAIHVLDPSLVARTLRHVRPAAVITDLQMPERDGYAVMMDIADHDRDLPVMVTTVGEQALLGAAAAWASSLRLSRVRFLQRPIWYGQMVDFLRAAGLLA